jgi:hypothetical protein
MLNAMAVVAICMICSSLAQAQATRTWVSGVGDDANPCSRTAPCKTFAGAISKTAPCGEISVLDPGGFGAVTITKSITLDGDGTLAGILSATVNGIIVQAGTTDKVVIRSISINGVCSGLNGIRFLAGKHLHVENCTISNITQNGIDVSLGATTVFNELSVTNTTFFNVGGAAISQVATSGGGGVPTAQITNCRMNSVGRGLDVTFGNATIANSAISHAAAEGVKSNGNGVTINAAGVVVDNSATGLSAAVSGATINFANCDIVNNSTGLNIVAGGTGNRFGNSRIFSNSNNINNLGTLNNPANQ